MDAVGICKRALKVLSKESTVHSEISFRSLASPAQAWKRHLKMDFLLEDSKQLSKELELLPGSVAVID